MQSIKKLRILTLLLSFLLSTTWVIGQSSVSGQVSSSNLEEGPLIGVSVLIKGTTKGVVTDFEGNYLIENIQATDTLILSYIGYETIIEPINGRSNINFSMRSASSLLDEVVVIAYGETSKRKFTGSLAQVDGSEFNNNPQTSAVQMIQGKAAGVLVEDTDGRPGSVGSIVIRGVGTLGGASEPLYVVDGTPTTNIASLNSNDIESISILKDAASTSIYGSRAANGVVLITTKKGESGKTKFNASINYGFSDIENPNNFRMMNSDEYVEYYREAYSAMGENPDDPNSGKYLPTSAANTNTDWLDLVTRTGVTQQYEISASGGTKKTNHFISLNHYNQEGIVEGTQFGRTTGRLNFTLRPSSKFNIDLNILGAYINEDLQFSDAGRGSTFSGAFNVAPTASVFADETTPDNLNGLGYNFSLPSNAGHNPVATSDIRERTSTGMRAFPTMRLFYTPIENLSIISTASVDYSFNKENAYQSKFYFAETDNGLSELATEVYSNSNFNATAKYDWVLSDKHQITPLVGFELYRSNFTQEISSSRDFAFDGINNVAAGAVPLDRGFIYQGNSLASFFGRLNYSFSNKFFADLSYRRDGSSRFGPENRWGSFYAIGGGYNLSDEAFMQNQKVISTLRARVSYGIQGNNDIDDFAWRNAYNTNGVFIVPPTNGGTGVPNSGSQPSEPGNQLLKWEQSESFNFGLDFGIANDRISGSIDYYQRSSIDLLANRLISSTSGFVSIIDNVGDVKNSGIELAIQTLNMSTNDFNWTSNFNISFNKNEIISLNGVADTLFADGADNRIIRIVGQPIDQWYLPQYAGVDQATGQPLYSTTEGGTTTNINDAETMVSGQTSLTPDFYGGFGNTLSYKQLSFSFMFYFKYGFDVYRSHLSALSVPSGNNQPASNLARWQQPGDVTNIPSADDMSALLNSTRWLEDGSYLRLRNASLAYSIPTPLIEKIGLSDLRLSIRAVNLLTFTKFQGFNPDAGFFENDDYPINRTITFGLSTQF